MLERLMPLAFWSDRALVERAMTRLPSVTYERLREKGFAPKTIIDIGAYHGEWAALAANVFPEATVVMFEALEEKRQLLQTICNHNKNFRLEIFLLGRRDMEERQFYVQETGSSLYAERSNAGRNLRTMATARLDTVLAKHNVAAPIFLKLDVQGAELEILSGAPKTLAACEVIQLEVALLPYNDGAPLAAEVIASMDSRGFKLHDISGFVRPFGRDLVQVDVIFAHCDSKLRPDFFRFD
jgi:FkbM family methyltransferase